MGLSEDVERLRHHVAEAMTGMGDPHALLPLLHKLARRSHEGSDENLFAHHQLAELLVDRSPWRAALHARRVLLHRPGDDRAWALTALCHTVLGHYRMAVNAYKKARQLAPDNPWYAHNLGHLMDIGLGKPAEALELLREAFEQTGQHPDLAASYGHALARAGQRDAARTVIADALEAQSSRELEALLSWIDDREPMGVEPRLSATPRALHHRPSERSKPTDSDGPSTRVRERTSSKPSVRVVARRREKIQAALERGLAHLPLDDRQRERARTLATDMALGLAPPAAEGRSRATFDWESLAAAVAYAIVYVDHVPLSETEVAATFRVSASALRGRFRELRSRLHLRPGDTRYSTSRAR